MEEKGSSKKTWPDCPEKTYYIKEENILYNHLWVKLSLTWYVNIIEWHILYFIFVYGYSYINKANTYFEGLNDAVFIILFMSSNTLTIAIHCLLRIEQTERYFFRKSDFLRAAYM